MGLSLGWKWNPMTLLTTRISASPVTDLDPPRPVRSASFAFALVHRLTRLQQRALAERG